jgi:hypothetical protein
MTRTAIERENSAAAQALKVDFIEVRMREDDALARIVLTYFGLRKYFSVKVTDNFF